MNGFWRLISYIRNYKLNVTLNIICNILMVIFAVVSIPALIPFLEILLDQAPLVTEKSAVGFGVEQLKQNFYYYLSQIIIEFGKQRALVYLCVGIIVIFFFKNLFRYLSLFFMAPVRNGIVRDIREDLFRKMMSLNLAYFSEERKGDLISRITADVQEVEWSILNVLEVIVREPLMIIGSLIIMIYISPHLTLFVFVLLIFTGLIIGGIGKVLKRQSHLVQTKLGVLVSIVEESLSGLRVVKAFNAEEQQTKKFRTENNDYKRILTRLFWRRDLSSPLSEFMGISIVAVLIWYGYGSVQSGDISPATFIVFLYAFYSVITPAKSFSTAYYNIQKGLAAVGRVEHIIDTHNPIEESNNPIHVHKFTNKIEFENVSFCYNKAEGDVLKNIDLVIPVGQTIALVGPSGAGKSTIADLVPRFYDVTSGQISIDGVDIKKLALYDLRALISIVTQDPILFNDSIHHNIAFGIDGVSRSDVIEAAKKANAHDFIMNTEDGYDTHIGDSGVKLSGGQKQRLTISRAILKNPPILILDEATSALDSASEKLVQHALEQVMKDRTSIVIAHRLSTIRNADRIVVMKNGQIIEEGDHNNLLKQQGEYFKLVNLQS